MTCLLALDNLHPLRPLISQILVPRALIVVSTGELRRRSAGRQWTFSECSKSRRDASREAACGKSSSGEASSGVATCGEAACGKRAASWLREAEFWVGETSSRRNSYPLLQGGDRGRRHLVVDAESLANNRKTETRVGEGEGVHAARFCWDGAAGACAGRETAGGNGVAGACRNGVVVDVFVVVRTVHLVRALGTGKDGVECVAEWHCEGGARESDEDDCRTHDDLCVVFSGYQELSCRLDSRE
jgi:hypothetical protein